MTPEPYKMMKQHINRRSFLHLIPEKMVASLHDLRRSHPNLFPGEDVTAENVMNRVAYIKSDRCLAWSGSTCQACYLACPEKEKAIFIEDQKPRIVNATCDGCGECVDACRLVNDVGAIGFRPAPRREVR